MSFEFKIGADPELFVVRGKDAVSAYDLIPGTKEVPYSVDGGAVQVDGMALEFNVTPVTLLGGNQDIKGWIGNISKVEKQLKEMVEAKDNTLSFNISSVQEFPEELLKTQPKEAVELGCNPDFNAYTKSMNPTPNGEAVNFRTASGHIHVGWGADIPTDNPEHIEICCDFIKYLDATVGLYMTIIDADPRRRELYGKAGAFRPKPYGVEYRTPSNAWLKSDERKSAIFRLTQLAVNYAQQQKKIEAFTACSPEEIRNIIDTGDWKKAAQTIEYFKYFLSDVTMGFIDKEIRLRKEAEEPKDSKKEYLKHDPSKSQKGLKIKNAITVKNSVDRINW